MGFRGDVYMVMVRLACLAVFAFTVGAQGKRAPDIAADFTVRTTEVNKDNATVVEQFLAFDTVDKRSNMYAVGSLVKGAMQQINRRDLRPAGWYMDAGGSNAQDPSSWACTNLTVSAEDEDHSRMPNFWDFPNTMEWAGADNVNGIVCDRWNYVSSGQNHSVWIMSETATPVASGVPGVYT